MSTDLISALQESIEDLQDEVTRLRNTNRMLRGVNSKLRTQINIAHNNDEAFKAYCQVDITADVEAQRWITSPQPSQSDSHECQ
jgi:hypothetical protein